MRVTISHVETGDSFLDIDGHFVLGDSGTGEFRRAVALCLERGCSALHVDLSGVTRLDAAALGHLVAAHAACQEAGMGLTIRGISPVAYDLMVLTRVLTLFALPAIRRRAA